jgi:hypothetical protein
VPAVDAPENDTAPVAAPTWNRAASAPPVIDQLTAMLAVSVWTAVAGTVTATALAPVIVGGTGTVTEMVLEFEVAELFVATTVTA